MLSVSETSLVLAHQIMIELVFSWSETERILVASTVVWHSFPDIHNRLVILLMLSIANVAQGCGGVCAQVGCHHREQSILQRSLQAGEHQPSQQVCPAV